MKHSKKGRKFGRETKQRKELLRGLARSLILKNKITTTQAKAKSLRPFVEKLITAGRAGGVAKLRMLAAELGAESARRLIKDIVPKFSGRAGGYTRILNLPPRLSDGARMSIIEFVE